ncbi:MAG: hypothetical protein FWC48_02990 [Actinomycetia bacterium]|nr:hypothetical protein [Actinomycetes bacterium]
MVEAVSPELERSKGGASAFDRIIERETQLIAEVEEAREKGQYLVTHATDDKDKITKQALEDAHARALKEAAAIKASMQARIAEMQAHNAKESAALRSDLETAVTPAVEMVIALVTGAQALEQGGDA